MDKDIKMSQEEADKIVDDCERKFSKMEKVQVPVDEETWIKIWGVIPPHKRFVDAKLLDKKINNIKDGLHSNIVFVKEE